MADLRRILAERATESKAERDRQKPRSGAFTSLDDRHDIRFVTFGRVSGQPREKWWLPFAPDGDTLYLLEERGDSADWVRNAVAGGRVRVEDHEARARVVDDPDEERRARQLCQERFARVGLAVQDLTETGLVVAFDAG